MSNTGLSERSGAAPGETSVLRRRPERQERQRKRAAARVRRQRERVVRQDSALQGRGQGGAQLRRADAVSGGGHSRESGAG